MMRMIQVGMVVIGMIGLVGGSAKAEEYPWCADVQMGPAMGTNCGFRTRAQCEAAASGTGGVCYRNPEYKERAPANSQQRKRRNQR